MALESAPTFAPQETLLNFDLFLRQKLRNRNGLEVLLYTGGTRLVPWY